MNSKSGKVSSVRSIFIASKEKSCKFLITIRGHAEFYPNQGRAPQPGCETLDIFTVSGCSHYRAPLYFAESILVPHSFCAYQCDLSLIQLPTYRNCLNASNVVLMGEHIDREYVFLSSSFYTKSLISQFSFRKTNFQFGANVVFLSSIYIYFAGRTVFSTWKRSLSFRSAKGR